MSKFRIDYDDQHADVIDKINQALISHGLTIIEIEDLKDEEDEDGGSLYYEIIKFIPDGK